MKRKNEKSKAKKHLLLVIPALFVLLGTSFAWFMHGDYVSNSSIEMSVINPNYLTIRVDENEEYKTGTKEFKIDENFSYKEVCASFENDDISFYTVENTVLSDPSDKGDYTSTGVTMTGLRKLNTSEINDYVFTLDFSLKSLVNSNLYLSPKSYVSPLSVENITSSYGDFSKDYIAGSVRVALYKYNEGVKKYELCFIWIPNTQIELSLDQDGYHLNPNGNVETSYRFLRDKNENVDIETNSLANGSQTIVMNSKDVNIVWGDLKENDLPVTIIGEGESKYRMVSWIDGYDRETKIPLAGGKVNMNLILSLEKEESEVA